ncbi:NAD(P)/FAD-dependent oxidoreductase [Paenibacillus aestuarii]|uniref:NADH:ubiquinone reductase (non-electrogenic) n=1 Tax=Paenibacillus aestuarii TaxID=516965 RepID=A0ABW0KBL8_9BACL|nr:FAD-dependent oxidoreductase [Paenibacillus aestuarii]
MEQRIVVVGGGYAGLNAVNALQKQFASDPRIQLVLIDKESFHLRKVLLFQRAVQETPIKVPYSDYFGDTVEVIQAELIAVEPEAKQIRICRPDGAYEDQPYDRLILCLGSKVVSASPEQGGISLTDMESGDRIRRQLEQNLSDARRAVHEAERRRLLSVAIVGGGITGIETAGELASGLRRKAAAAGLDPAEVAVTLINSQQRLLEAAPPHVSRRLEQELSAIGVRVKHGSRAEQFRDGELALRGGELVPVGACVWTLGLRPNPLVQRLGLPITSDGKLQVDAQYHVHGSDGIYAIGDCAHIMDPVSGAADGMTCKEAIPQAGRLAKIIKAELASMNGPQHASYTNVFCISLGPDRGLVWLQKWGMNLVLTGKVGLHIRKLTWDMASLLSGKQGNVSELVYRQKKAGEGRNVH